MSVRFNRRVMEQADRLKEAEINDSDKVEAEEEKYWKIFEEEYSKDSFAVWAFDESSEEVLRQYLDWGDVDVETMKKVLADYIKFYDIVEKYTPAFSRDTDLVKRAEEYIKNAA